jgi:hypothetical protein
VAPVACGSHDGSPAPGMSLHNPPLLAPAAYLSLNSPFVVPQHYCTTRSPMTAGYPCFEPSSTLLLLHQHALGLLIAIWPVLFVTSASFDFPVDESIALAGSRQVSSLAGSLASSLETHQVDLYADEDHPPLPSNAKLLPLQQ